MNVHKILALWGQLKRHEQSFMTRRIRCTAKPLTDRFWERPGPADVMRCHEPSRASLVAAASHLRVKCFSIPAYYYLRVTEYFFRMTSFVSIPH
jgi:hypothetical protein